MIQAQNLPPNKSVYDYPVTFPGQPLTEEQQKQAQLAQIAGIVLSVAAAKQAMEQVVTNQIVNMLRVTDLTSEVAVDNFAKTAAKIVKMAVRRSQQITWTGVAARANVVGVPFPASTPSEKAIPVELRYSRKSSLYNAYKRLAEEYKTNLQRSADDNVIKELVQQFESQALTPMPRPDVISNDAIERVVDGKEDWRKAFLEADKAREDKVAANSETSSDAADAEDSLRNRARQRAEERARRDAERNAQRAKERDARDAEWAKASQPNVGAERGSGEEDSNATITLTRPEVDKVIEKYAQQKAEERAERMVGQDIAVASRNMHQLAMRNLDQKKVTGFRRVVHPELSESGQSCGLCIVASTHRYTRRDLMPIHDNCHCETVEIYEIDGVEFDPGDQINIEDLEVFYTEAARNGEELSTHGWDLKRQTYKVIDHPEYGPTLVNVASGKKTENVPFQYIEKESK